VNPGDVITRAPRKALAWLAPVALGAVGFVLLGAGIAYGACLDDGPRQLMTPVVSQQPDTR
jgi:hypothetical protein